jgi:myo-inositol 2-dehydrogenase/D-chiro-inositol 1-dehydrogenase
MIRVALVGTGAAFEIHAGLMPALEDVKVSVCVSRSQGKAEEAAARFGCRPCTTLRDALPDCDAVVLCTPPDAHRSHALEAMEAGKAVLVEKPMAVELADAQAMVETAERTGTVLMMGFNNCFRDGFRLLHDLIADGTIGTLHSFYMHRQSGSFIKEGVSNWRNSAGVVCGHTIESLSHDLSVLRYCVGEVKAVKAYTLNTLSYAPAYDNTAVVGMELASGALASIHSDWNSPLAFNVRGASGSRGAVSLSGSGNWELREARIRTVDMRYDEIRVLNDSLNSVCYRREWEAFIAAIQGRAQPVQTGRDGLKVLELSHAILTSAKTGKEVLL